MSLHDKSLGLAPSRIQDNVWTRHILPGQSGAEPYPGPVDWGRPGGGGVEGGASNEIPLQQRTCVRLLFIKQV